MVQTITPSSETGTPGSEAILAELDASLSGSDLLGQDEHSPVVGESDTVGELVIDEAKAVDKASQADIQDAIDIATRNNRADKFLALLERANKQAVRAGGIAIATLLALLLTACGPDGDPVTATPTTQSASPSPSETEAPEVGPSAAELEQINAELAPYLAMENDEFAALPQPEHDKFAALIMKRDLPKFAADWATESDNPADSSVPVVSVDSDKQIIVNNVGWKNRLVFWLTGDEREKFRISIYHDGAASQQYQLYQKTSDEHPNSIAGWNLADNDLFGGGFAQSTTGNLTDGNGNIYQDITMKSEDGQIFTVRMYHSEVTVLGDQVVEDWKSQ